MIKMFFQSCFFQLYLKNSFMGIGDQYNFLTHFI